MARKTRRVTPDGTGNWKVKKDGASRASGVYSTQKEAIDAAKNTGKREKEEVVIHGRNGQIRDTRSYGVDPNPPRDTDHLKKK